MSTITKNKEKEKIDSIISQPYMLILHNDDKNTFDHVIDCLIEICGHSQEQASQSAHIVHFKGKCDVKRGQKEVIEELCNKLRGRGLSSTFEEI